jgi:hypothetical protein
LRAVPIAHLSTDVNNGNVGTLFVQTEVSMQRWTRTLYLGTLPAYYSASDAEQRVNLLLLPPTIMLFNMAR